MKSASACLLARNLVKADAGTRYIHIRHSGWDHHKKIFDHKAVDQSLQALQRIDSAVANLLRDLSSSRTSLAGRTLLDDTLVVVATEFGRVPGPLNGVEGRHHYNRPISAYLPAAE